VLVAKPVVKTLAEHLKLLEAAKEHNVLVSQLPICPTKQAAS
jgi:predicted dehydrogenase